MMNFSKLSDRLSDVRRRAADTRQKVQDHFETMKNIHQPEYSWDLAPIIEKLAAYEYHNPNPIPKDRGMWAIGGIAGAGLIGWLVSQGIVPHVVIAVFAIGLIVGIFTAGKRAEKAFVEAFPDMQSLDEQRKIDAKIANNARLAAIHVLKQHQDLSQYFPWTHPQIFADEHMAEAKTAYFISRVQDTIDSFAGELLGQLQEFVDTSIVNKGTYDEQVRYWDTEKSEWKTKTEKRDYQFLTFIRTSRGIGYSLHGKTPPGHLDKVIDLLTRNAGRGQAILDKVNSRLAFARFQFDLADAAVPVVVEHDALVQAVLGVEPSQPMPEPETSDDDANKTINYDVTFRPNGPSVALLNPPKAANLQQRATDLEQNHNKLQKALSVQGFPNAKVKDVGVGPTLCAFNITIPNNEDPIKLISKQNALRIAGQLRGLSIQATSEGKILAVVERPNIRDIGKAETVYLSELLAQSLRVKGELVVPIGPGIDGKPIFADLTNFPHLIIGGQTKSGKSVYSNALLCSLAMRYSPQQLQISIFDPKGNEFTPFRGLPHLHGEPIYTDGSDAINLLLKATEEMDRRYRELFAPLDVANIVDYNVVSKEKLRYWVIYIDEWADLLGAADADVAKELEAATQRIVQKARAAGIHLILSTQRPSVDILNARIRSQIPARIAFKVDNASGSNIIINDSGAEDLAGFGDGYVKLDEFPEMKRFKSPFVQKEELLKVAEWIKAHDGPERKSESQEQRSQPSSSVDNHMIEPFLTTIQEPAIKATMGFMLRNNEPRTDENIRQLLGLGEIAYRQKKDPHYSLDLDWAVQEMQDQLRRWDEIVTPTNAESEEHEDIATPSDNEISRTPNDVFTRLAKNMTVFEKKLFTEALSTRKPHIIARNNVESLRNGGQKILALFDGDPVMGVIDAETAESSVQKVWRSIQMYLDLAYPDFDRDSVAHDAVEPSNNDRSGSGNTSLTPPSSSSSGLDSEAQLFAALRSKGFNTDQVFTVLEVWEQNGRNQKHTEKSLTEFGFTADELIDIHDCFKELTTND